MKRTLKTENRGIVFVDAIEAVDWEDGVIVLYTRSGAFKLHERLEWCCVESAFDFKSCCDEKAVSQCSEDYIAENYADGRSFGAHVVKSELGIQCNWKMWSGVIQDHILNGFIEKVEGPLGGFGVYRLTDDCVKYLAEEKESGE